MSGMKDLLGDTPYVTTDRALARTTDPETSKDAAKKINRKLNDLEQAVYDCIASGANGRTWDEIEQLTKLDKSSISPRFAPLRRKGFISARLGSDQKPIRRDGQTVWYPVLQ